MPPRGKYPGLKRGRHNLPYWIARQVARDTKGFPDSCIPLPADATDDELADLCAEHTARLRAWLDNVTDPDEPQLKSRYDGSFGSACRIYQEHPRSPFHKVKYNTRATYITSLKLIETTVGRRLIRKATVFDVEYWYDEWRKPAIFKDEDGNEFPGRERVDRAHDAVSMLRTVLYFMAGLRKPECKQLAEELKTRKFEKGGAREQEMNLAQVRAFIKKAFEIADGGVIPRSRALSMSIGVAAQFEVLLRQKDIIGEWLPSQAEALRAGPRVTPQRFGDEWWVGQFTWENVPGLRWRMKTSKSKYRTAAEFDLASYELLLPLLELVPHEERAGAIVKGEGGLPVRQSSYGKWFRQIARVAGIPDEVWLMDTRAGGITEAEEAGVDLSFIQDAATHSKSTTTLRYIRRRTKRIADVAEARAKSRKGGEDGGT